MHDLISLQMIEKFIAFDTTSRNSNLPLIEFVRDYLNNLGVECVLTHDDTGSKANLFATLGPTDRPGIILSGHTDVVPVDGQKWSSDPFALIERDGKLFGRGVVDMKGFLAIALAFAPEFLKRGLTTPIHYAMSYDEEVGCLGIHRLLGDLAKRSLKPLACIVGEPSEMAVVRAHKGKIGYHVDVTGLEAHTGVAHIGVNAVEAASEAIACLKRIARRIRDEGPYDPDFSPPPYTTIQSTIINGGTAVNIVAGACAFDFDIRYLPGESPYSYVNELKGFVGSAILPEMHAVSQNTGFTWTEVPGCAALDTQDDADVTDLARNLAHRNNSIKVGFGTEAGHFQEAGIPTIVCGPGSIDQAHKPDEYLAIEQVHRCEQFMRRLLDKICT